MDNNPDVVCIQETKKNKNSEKIKLDQFCKYTVIENRQGLNSSHNKCFLVHENIIVEEESEIRFEDFNCHVIKIRTFDGGIVIINIYIVSQHLSSSNDYERKLVGFYNELSRKILEFKRNNYKIVIGGDFNSSLDSQNRKKFIEDKFVEKSNLYLHHCEGYTFMRGNSKSNIDRVYSYPLNAIMVNYIGDCLGVNSNNNVVPDHRPIINLLNMGKGIYQVKDKKVFKWRKMDKIEWDNIDNKMVEDLNNWVNDHRQPVTSQEMMNYMCTEFKKKRNELSTHFFVKPNSVPYYSKKLKQMKDQLKKLRKYKFSKNKKSMFDKNKYNQLKNKYRKIIETERKKYMNTKRFEIEKSVDPKRVVNSLKKLGKLRNNIPVINTNNGKVPKTTTDSLNNLNQDFVNVGLTERGSEYDHTFINQKKDEVNELIKQMNCNTDDWKKQVDDYNITEEEILKEIQDYNKTSPGPDEITIEFLKKTPKWSSIVLKRVVTRSLKEGYVPCQLRNANVTPILKNPKKNRHIFKNYRPISVTSIVSRIIEKVIRRRILSKVEDKLPSYQYGGRQNMGTIEALVQVWTDILENGMLYKETNGVFLDISKCFDRLIQELLVWKLKYVCNVTDPLVKWIFEFLKNRKQRVKIWGTTSNWMNTKTGGPQGSVLLPLLFIMFGSDVPLDTFDDQKTRGAGFVDDIFIYGTGEVNQQIKDLNERLERIYDWSNKWGVDFNIDKCKSITFTKEQRLVRYDRTILMGGEIVKKVQEYQYLGIFLSSNMLFDYHVDYILKRIKKESFLLKSVCKKSKVGNRMFSKIFWTTNLRPIIEYGVIVWSSSLSKNKFKEIQQYQVDYLRENHRYGKTSCVSAIMMDLSEIEIGIRIGSIREKYTIKCMIQKVPRRIYRYFETKDQLPNYSNLVQRDDQFPTGYVNVEKHNGRKKYRSTVKFPGRRRNIHFYSDYARDAERQRISWINRNMNTWYPSHKPPETIFNFDNFYTVVKSSKLVSHNEIEDWKNIVGGDKTKLWKYILKIIKTRVKMKQESIWNENNVGIILKQFKNKWYEDKIIHVIENENVHLLKKLRIGNSKLRRHCKGGPLKKCINCGDDKVESIQHYLLECEKFDNQRNTLYNGIRGPLEEMGCNMTPKILMGFFEEFFQSKVKYKNHVNNMKLVIELVINYLVQTERFK